MWLFQFYFIYVSLSYSIYETLSILFILHLLSLVFLFVFLLRAGLQFLLTRGRRMQTWNKQKTFWIW